MATDPFVEMVNGDIVRLSLIKRVVRTTCADGGGYAIRVVNSDETASDMYVFGSKESRDKAFFDLIERVRDAEREAKGVQVNGYQPSIGSGAGSPPGAE